MPRKQLGQHFLIRQSVVNRILQALELQPEDRVLEIGPGKGALTKALARKSERLLLIEKDPYLAEMVHHQLEEFPSLRVVCEDFLDYSWEAVKEFLGDKFKVVSNLPYQAATAILLKLLHHLDPGTILVLMFQKEVADRLMADPHTKDYGSLTVVTQNFSRVKSIMEVPPGAFRPPPRVLSTVLKFKIREKPLVEMDQLPVLEKLLHAGFGHRRKMLRQNLKTFFQGENSTQIEARLAGVEADPRSRAEELSAAQWIQLMNSR